MINAAIETGLTKSLFVVLSEDSWQGDADAIVTVDGVAAFQGAVTTAHPGSGQRIGLGSYAASVDHQVAVSFTNDAYGGTPQTDRNLYVQDVLVDDQSTGASATLLSDGTDKFTIAASSGPVMLGSGPDTIGISINEDAWQGDAKFVLTLDGQQIGDVQTAQALRSSGLSQDFLINTTLGGGQHQLGVQFINDAWGGTSATDRNLFVTAVKVNGVDQSDTATLGSNGTATFQIAAPAPVTPPAPVTVGAGSQTIHIQVSEDSWQGDAQFTVSVDGKQVGAPLTVSAERSGGQVQDFFVKGDFGPGPHNIAVSFINDAYGGTAATDRNLFVRGIAMDGVAVANSAQDLYSNGSDTVQGSFAAAVVPPTFPPAGSSGVVGLVPVGQPTYPAGANVLSVGVGKEYQTIASAIGASHDGDVILVDSGTYTNDFAVMNAKISLIAVGGRVTMDATMSPPNLKGILTEETDLTVVGFDFTNSRIPDADGHNGAGIRVDNGNLVLENDSFSGNQDGLLTNAGTGISVTIDHSVFNDNGGNDGNGAGNIHNVYIGDVAFATATSSVFKNAQVGHEFKSRAVVNTLTNNTFISGVGIGTGSYDIDLPNGGKDVVANNTIIKGPNSGNSNMVHFGGEGIPYAGSSLTVQDNLFTNTDPGAKGLLNQTSITVNLTGNVLDGVAAGDLVNGPAKETNNWDISGTMLPDTTLVGVLPGNTLIITDAVAHNVILNGPVQAVQGGAGLLTVDVQIGHVIVIGGTGGVDIKESQTSGTGGNQYTTTAGSTNTLSLAGGLNTIDSEGNDAIIAGNGNQSAQINGHATVTGGAGTSYWSVNGRASIDTGSGSAFMTLGAAASLAITGTNDFFELDTTGGSATWDTRNAGSPVFGSLSGGAVSMQVYTGAASITTAGGGDGTTLHLDRGDATVKSGGADTVYAGAGADTVIVSGAAQVHAGSGVLSVFGRGDPGGADVFGAGGDVTIGGDTGNITYHGGDQANTVEAQLSNITLLGGAGLMTVNSGSRDTVTGGQGGLVFNDFGNGANTITTQAGASDVLNISGSDQVNSYGTDTITLDGGNTSIAVYGNSNLTLGDGNSHVSLAGQDTVTVKAGYNNFDVSQGGKVTFVLSTLNNINETGASVSVAFTDPTLPGAGTVNMTVTGGVAAIQANPGGGVSVSTDGSSPATITAAGPEVSITSSGADAIHLGAGAGLVTLYGTGAEVWAGSGATTLHDYNGSSGAFTLHGGDGPLVLDQASSTMTFIGGVGAAHLTGGQMSIVAGSGDITAGSTQILAFQGGSGVADLSLDSRGSTIDFGTGSSAIHESGGGASNTFAFLAGQSGKDTIYGFQVSVDKAVLGAGVQVASQSIVGGSLQATLNSGAQVTFEGITSTQGVFG